MTAAGMVSLILAAAGLIVMTVSLIGLIRFPDFFTRLHIQGVGDTLGALLIILAMMTATGAHLITIKIFLIFLVIMLTNPIGTNLMMIAAIFDKDYQAYTWIRPGSRPENTDISKTKAAETDKPSVSGKEKPDTGNKGVSAKQRPSMKKTRAELVEIAEGMGISVPEHATKKGILELIYMEKPELRPEKSYTKQSGSKQSGSGKTGSKRSGSKQNASRQSSAKKDKGADNNKSTGKSNSKNRSRGANKGRGRNASGRAGSSKAKAKADSKANSPKTKAKADSRVNSKAKAAKSNASSAGKTKDSDSKS